MVDHFSPTEQERARIRKLDALRARVGLVAPLFLATSAVVLALGRLLPEYQVAYVIVLLVQVLVFLVFIRRRQALASGHASDPAVMASSGDTTCRSARHIM